MLRQQLARMASERLITRLEVRAQEEPWPPSIFFLISVEITVLIPLIT